MLNESNHTVTAHKYKHTYEMYVQVYCKESETQYLWAFMSVTPPRQITFTHKHWECWRFASLPLEGQTDTGPCH